MLGWLVELWRKARREKREGRLAQHLPDFKPVETLRNIAAQAAIGVGLRVPVVRPDRDYRRERRRAKRKRKLALASRTFNRLKAKGKI